MKSKKCKNSKEEGGRGNLRFPATKVILSPLISILNQMLSIRYNKSTDNPPFDDLIQTNVVLNSTGEVAIIPPTTIPKSIQDVNYVSSGRGMYRGWISNLQKAIRKGETSVALRSAYECFQMDGPFKSHVINRVCKVIISEDIGLASTECLKMCVEYIQKQEKTLQELFTIIHRMCTGYKSRIVDHSIHLFTPEPLADFNTHFSQVKRILSERTQLDSLKEYALSIRACVSTGSEKITYMFSNTILSASGLKKRGPFSKLYLLWNLLYTTAENDKKKDIVNLFIIWCEHKSEENILNVLHAAYIVYFNLPTHVSDGISEEVPSVPEIASRNDLWITSSAYDKHTRRWKGQSSFRNTIGFFLKYGCKLDKLHPQLESIEEEMYAQLVKLNTL